MVREIAWRILRRGTSVPSREVERAAREHGLDARDRGLLRRLVGTEVRRRGTLTAIAHAFARGRPDPDLVAHLRLGFVQIFFLDQIPDHAALCETVAAVRSTLGERPGSYANAVLRAALAARRPGTSGDPRRDLALRSVHLAEPVFADPKEHPLLWAEQALSLPTPLVRLWVRRYGEERAFELARGALEEPDLSLRALAPIEEAESALRALGTAPRRCAHPSVLLVGSEHTESVLQSDLFVRGGITVQGETALRAAELLEGRAGERLLDLCAAPGGKTAVLAASGARVLATDVHPERLVRLQSTLARLQSSLGSPQSSLGNLGGSARATAVDLPHVIACDAAACVVPDSFDGVLVDAPCTNTGVLAQRPEARWRFLPAARNSLGALQTRLIESGARCVRPGGRLVYSTCSLEPEENRRRVDAFLATRADFSVESEIESLPIARGGSGPVDGGYAVRLRRG